MSRDAYIRAQRVEIAKRYRWARKQNRKPITMAALRLKDLGKLLDARYPQGLPNDPQGRDFVTIMAHHLAALPRNNPTHTIPGFIRYYAKWMTHAETDELITATIANPTRWNADALAWRLKLCDADRTALQITTIGAIDCPKHQRLQRRKAKSKERSRKWREKQKSAQ